MNLIYAYYENGGMLDRQVEEWESYAPEVKQKLQVFMVDDGSQNDPAVNHLKPVGFPIHLYRVIPNLVWNQTGARNLAMHNATDDWCMMMDMDCLLTADQAQLLISGPWRSRRFYMPQAANYQGVMEHQHPNCILVERNVFWESGGYDEDFQGWYGSDAPFKAALSRVAKRVDTNIFHIRRVRREDIADASTREWGRKGTEYHSMKNPVLRAKRKTVYKAENPLRFPWEKVCVI
jgi:hypothetical protein